MMASGRCYLGADWRLWANALQSARHGGHGSPSRARARPPAGGCRRALPAALKLLLRSGLRRLVIILVIVLVIILGLGLGRRGHGRVKALSGEELADLVQVVRHVVVGERDLPSDDLRALLENLEHRRRAADEVDLEAAREVLPHRGVRTHLRPLPRPLDEALQRVVLVELSAAACGDLAGRGEA
ncbi:hypothetical protein T492DRAFT_1030614 [Pavlovales sp. CCMP2436]|nr:hypothetical protein T492DRAFT_1030614 [Pavlovales sp. CCMP2436]